MTNSETNESMDQNRMQSEATEQAALKPGAQLAALRESKGWTVEQVANHLNLATRQVQAIESDNYDALPGMAVTRGFMRAYAKLLQVDPVPLLASLPGHTTFGTATPGGRKTPPNTPFPKAQLGSSKESRSFFTSWKAGILLVIAILAIAAVMEKRNELPPVLSGLGMVFSPPSAETVAPQAAPAPASEPPSPQQEATPAQTNPASTSESSAPASMPAPSTAAATSPAPAADVAANPAETAGEAASARNALVLTFREDSWVEVKRADNRLLMSRVGKAGSTETIAVTQPVSVVIGNASGVDAVWQGKPLELKAGAKSNVARLDLK